MMWATAAQSHSKYDEYSDVFYQRARQYMEADEMKASPLQSDGARYVH